MMSKTHLSVGMAAALAVSPAANLSECLIILAGGAIGGVIPDVDILDDDYKHDALIGEVVAFSLLIVSVIASIFNGNPIINYVTAHKLLAIIGGIGFIVLWFVGFSSDHRDFTHSFLCMLLFSICIVLIYPSFFVPFAIGYFSHLALDILNKKGIRLFFPSDKEICFGLCYASKIGNAIFMIIGFIATAFLIIYRLDRSLLDKIILNKFQ